jgi:tetratricopeptide (TPR) repeat protein
LGDWRQRTHHSGRACLGRYEDALREGERLTRDFPNNEELTSALALLALDANDIGLAQRYVQGIEDAPAGSTVLGYLALNDQNTDKSTTFFDRAISKQPNNARAWVGKGLSLLLNGDAAAGAKSLDHGAQLFGTHLGSWIASGWAYFAAGDYTKARAKFERARSIDETFSESYGGIAVLDILEGKTADAIRNCEIAHRLDKSSFSAALAKSMLLQAGGNPALAERIRTSAMSMPVGPDGQTLAQALVKYQMRLR